MSRLSRRSLLASSALAGAGTFGWPSFLRRALAAAAGPTGPKRLVLMYMPNCSIRNRWVSTGGRDAEAGSGDAGMYTLNQLTMPLQPIMPYTTLLHGLNMDSVDGDQHSSGMIRITTGKGVIMPNINGGPGNLPTGPSMDTLIAEQSTLVNAASTPFKRLVLSADTRSPSLHHRCISSDLSSAFIAPDNDPAAVFDRLFSDASLGAAGTSAQDRAAALEKLRTRKQSVLDFMSKDLARLQRRAPSAQRTALDSHLTAINALEKSLSAEAATPTGAAPAMPPVKPVGLAPNKSETHPKVVQAFFDIVRTSFELDLTRVVSLCFGTGNSAVSFADFDAGPSGGVHNISHQSQNSSTMDKLSTVTMWYCARVAEFAQSLAAIPEAGGTVLDNTLILFFSEVGQWHEHNDVPMALIGGKNLGNPGNRVLRYKRQVNDVGQAILKQFQLPMVPFGDQKWAKGPAPELFV